MWSDQNRCSNVISSLFLSESCSRERHDSCLVEKSQRIIQIRVLPLFLRRFHNAVAEPDPREGVHCALYGAARNIVHLVQHFAGNFSILLVAVIDFVPFRFVLLVSRCIYIPRSGRIYHQVCADLADGVGTEKNGTELGKLLLYIVVDPR